MEPRIKNPGILFPDAMQAIMTLNAVTENGGVPKSTLELVHLRTSQINGCHLCGELATCSAKQTGQSDERITSVADWQSANCFTAAERAALALTESVTKLDGDDPVPDAIWDEAARHYDERALATLLIAISLANVYNRINIATKQVSIDLAS